MSGEKEEQEEQESILGSQCQEALLSVRLVVVDTYQAGWRTLIGSDQSRYCALIGWCIATPALLCHENMKEAFLAFCYVFMA